MAAAADRVQRFAAALHRLVPGGRIGLAVSGGPDSLALLALAQAHDRERIEVVTVNHALRAEGAEEAAGVAALCAGLGIPHVTLREGPPALVSGGPQASARAHRYRLMAAWGAERGLAALLTAHHADDQAETLLMRLARGAGLAGMSGIRESQQLHGARVVRPLLGFTRSELAAVVADAGWRAADDPSNRDARFDRTQARALLAGQAWLRPDRLSATAHHLAQAEDALAWAADREAGQRLVAYGGAWLLDPADLPAELLRRLVVIALMRLAPTDSPAPGPDIMRLIARLRAGEHATLGGAMVRPGSRWRFVSAPPHRSP